MTDQIVSFVWRPSNPGPCAWGSNCAPAVIRLDWLYRTGSGQSHYQCQRHLDMYANQPEYAPVRHLASNAAPVVEIKSAGSYIPTVTLNEPICACRFSSPGQGGSTAAWGQHESACPWPTWKEAQKKPKPSKQPVVTSNKPRPLIEKGAVLRIPGQSQPLEVVTIWYTGYTPVEPAAVDLKYPDGSIANIPYKWLTDPNTGATRID